MTKTAQRLLSYLPAIYRDEPLVGRYLWAFEQLQEGLESQIEALPRQFDPADAREDFVQWLSTWMAFTLRADLDVSRQRQFLARIVSLYRRRGTKQNLYELLRIFTRGGELTITEGPQPHYFTVTMSLPPNSAPEQLRQSAIAHALVELEKPAHTHYSLDLQYPTMQIGVTSTIGVDTLIGTDARATATALES